jgi:hypothetical protein
MRLAVDQRVSAVGASRPVLAAGPTGSLIMTHNGVVAS